MNVFLFGNVTKDISGNIGLSIINKLDNLGFNIYVDQSKYNCDKSNKIVTFDIIDFVIILGGDGTIIDYLRKYQNYSIPFLGINLGRVGALAIAELGNYVDYLNKIKEKEYRVEKRTILCGNIISSENNIVFEAYNDITLSRNSLKMLGMCVNLDNSQKSIIYADGVVIATPTGSSAYNLSCGGPLLLPNAKCFVLTPINPQFKAFSSIVIDDEHYITMGLMQRSEKALLSIDGCESFEINNNDKIIIKKSVNSFKMICFDKPGALFNPLHKVAMAINKE